MARILFVYNADDGLKNAVLDYGKKYISPSTYDCKLCKVSFGPFGMKKGWKNFIANLPYDTAFLHKNEFSKQFHNCKIDFPAIIKLEDSTSFKIILSAEDFKNIHNLEDLKNAVSSALDKESL